MWSDECSVERSAGTRSQYVFRVPADKWKPFAIQPVARSGRVSVMVWAAFSGVKKSPLVLVERDPDATRGGVTGKVYLDMLKRHPPALCGTDTIFMQDNAPIHTYAPVREWLTTSGYRVMDWPPYSPDLNPIEHCWFPLKLNTQRASPQLPEMSCTAAEEELRRVLPDAWEGIEWDHFVDLIRSMPKRVNAIIQSQGWYTKY